MFMKFFNVFKKRKTYFKFLHDKDAEKYLKSVGIYEHLKNGEVSCLFCGDLVDTNTFAALVPQQTEIKVVCNRLKCIDKVRHD